jgi:flagellum-specific ATP synthase
MNEPIADAARSILDGHIVLSRRLASAGHYPCIDILDSVSRVSSQVTTRPQAAAATELRRLLAAERDARDLVDIGAYVPGSNPTVDRALALSPGISAYLCQPSDEIVPADASWSRLLSLMGTPS